MIPVHLMYISTSITYIPVYTLCQILGAWYQVPGVHIVCVEQPKSRASNVFRDVHIMRIVRHKIHNT